MIKDEKCKELIWVDDTGDGYSGKEKCGGTLESIAGTRLFQCDKCKKVIKTLINKKNV